MPFTMPFRASIGWRCGCFVETRDKVNWTITHCPTHGGAGPFGRICENVAKVLFERGELTMPFMALKDKGLIKAFMDRGLLPPECSRFFLDVKVGRPVRLYTESTLPYEFRDLDLASLLEKPEPADAEQPVAAGEEV